MEILWPRFLTSPRFRTIIATVAVIVAMPVLLAFVRAPRVSSITRQLSSMAEQNNAQTEAAKVDFIGASSAITKTHDALMHQLDIEANHNSTPTPQSASRAAPDVHSAHVLVIGDSVTLGAKDALESTISSVFVDAIENRGMWAARNILANYAASGRLPDVIVISLITNDFNITDGLLQGIMDVAGPGHTFVFVTGYAGPQQPREIHNATLKNFVNQRGNAYLADWWELSHNNWSLMYADHIHLNPEGRRAYANLINNVIRSTRR
jgi:hypothetical protein